jgi:hypothetical protein
MANETAAASTSTVTEAGTEEATSTVTEAAVGETKAPATETKAAAGEAKGEAKPDPKAEAAKLEAAVAKLELKLPEGLDAKHPTVAAFKKLAAEHGLDSAKAQKFFDAHRAELAATEKSVREASEKSGAEWLANQRKEWRGALQKDAEYGGAKWAETKAAVSRAFNKYGASDPELKAFLDDGAGDHPAVVKLLARIGKDLAEDKAATTSKGNGATPKPERGPPEALRRTPPTSSPDSTGALNRHDHLSQQRKPDAPRRGEERSAQTACRSRSSRR